MATHDAASATLEDFDVEPGVAAREHTPTLHPGDRFVRCRSCGVSVPYDVTAEGPIRRALEELAAVECGRAERPDRPVGEHVPTITPAHPDRGRNVVCESCGRAAPLVGDRERVLRQLADVPCVDGLSYTELVNLVFSPTGVTPSLPELGVHEWYGRPGTHHGGDVRRVFRHGRSQYAAYVVGNADGTYTARVTGAPSPAAEPVAELHFPGDDPSDPATRKTAVTFVTFLAATDGLSAGEFGQLRRAYEEAHESHREAWLQGAYDRAREKFRERYDGSPEAFAEAFADSVDDAEEALRRLVGSGGFGDAPEAAFARETLGRDHGFPGFADFVADRYDWSPPVPDA
jgi:hypothetical protein